jgi:hypothetical protein
MTTIAYFIPSRKQNKKILCFNGYRYTKEKAAEFYWRCSDRKNKCPGRVVKRGLQIIQSIAHMDNCGGYLKIIKIRFNKNCIICINKLYLNINF